MIFLRILMVGDVVGRAGRYSFAEHTKILRQEKKIDVVVVNGENIAHGNGITQSTFNEILSGGADIVTNGNHVWDNRDVLKIIDDEPFLIRPANYPEGAPGKGFCIYPYRAKNIGVINLQGRTFLKPLDCPFTCAEEIVKKISEECDIILVDFHAEATSEKIALGYFLDGKVTAVVGTHTHVQTADERILPKGTAYMTDLGMVGPTDSVIGVKVESVVNRFVSCMPSRFDVAEGACTYCALIIDIDDKTNKALAVERIRIVEE